MSGHTVVVAQGALKLNSCEQFAQLLRVPVLAYYTGDGHGSGEGMSDVEQSDSEAVADTLFSLSELVAMGTFPAGCSVEERDAWIQQQLATIRECASKVDEAVASGQFDQMLDTAEALRVATLTYASGLRMYEAAQDSEADADVAK